MRFCPNCKSMLIPKDGVLQCICGYIEFTPQVINEKFLKPKEIEVIDEALEHIGDDVAPMTCWNCGNVGVYFWMVQMRRADEPPTRFYKCKKCKKVWRSGK